MELVRHMPAEIAMLHDLEGVVFSKWLPATWKKTCNDRRRYPREHDHKAPDMNTLRLSCFTGHVDLLDQELASGRHDVNDTDYLCRSALYWAIGTGNFRAVELLLSHGADSNSRNCGDFTPLLLALRKDFYNVVELLLAHGADPNVSRSLGGADGIYNRWSHPIHVACENGNLEAVRLLLRHGADPRAKTENSTTALWFAARGGHENIMKLLIDLGSNDPEQWKSYAMALDIAAESYKVGAIRLILENWQ